MNRSDEAQGRPKAVEGSVTVLTAAYNAGPFLERAIRSALEQTLAPAEVLIVDDASTDDTASVAEELIRTDGRVRLIRLPENGGPAVARNAGLQAARGDWVAVLDADDAMLSDRLERLLRIGAGFQADVVADNFHWYDARSESVGRPGIPDSDEVEVIDCYQFADQARPFTNQADWGLLKPMFRRRFLQDRKLRYPDFCRHGEDFLLMLDLLVAGGRMILCRSPGYLYTTRDSGLSRTIVDYDGMVRTTADLLEVQPISTDQRLKSILRARMRALKRLSAERKVQASMSAGDFGRLGRDVLGDYWMARAALRLGLRKVNRSLR